VAYVIRVVSAVLALFGVAIACLGKTFVRGITYSKAEAVITFITTLDTFSSPTLDNWVVSGGVDFGKLRNDILQEQAAFTEITVAYVIGVFSAVLTLFGVTIARLGKTFVRRITNSEAEAIITFLTTLDSFSSPTLDNWVISGGSGGLGLGLCLGLYFV